MQLGDKIVAGYHGPYIYFAKEAAEKAVIIDGGDQIGLAVVQVDEVSQGGEGVDGHPHRHRHQAQLAHRGQRHKKKDVFNSAEI